jgi:hypothetical protein
VDDPLNPSLPERIRLVGVRGDRPHGLTPIEQEPCDVPADVAERAGDDVH